VLASENPGSQSKIGLKVPFVQQISERLQEFLSGARFDLQVRLLGWAMLIEAVG